MDRLTSILGLFAMIGIAWSISIDRKAIRWRPVIVGSALQLVFALVILRTVPGRRLFEFLGGLINKFLGFTEAGARFVFGNLVQRDVPVGVPSGGGLADSGGLVARTDAAFGFFVLSTIVFFSSVIAVLYYFGVLQKLVALFARLMMRTMGTSGSESLSASANIFVGQTEAPMLVRPYVGSMTQSELMAVMTGGFATIAGGVMAAYVSMGVSAEHLLAASVMSAPAALVMAKVVLPETEESKTAGEVKIEVARPWANSLDAAASGAADGLKLALNVGAMLIAFVALIAVVDWPLEVIGRWIGFDGLSLKWILGQLGRPLAWLMGVPWGETHAVGTLLGIKTAVNEFVGYIEMEQMVAAGRLSERSQIIATYALCGFSNFSSIAIQIGGIGGMAPERKSDLARLGLRAMIAGSLACFQTATIAGILL